MSGLFLSLSGLGVVLQLLLLFTERRLHDNPAKRVFWTIAVSALLLPFSLMLWLVLGSIGLQQSGIAPPSWLSLAVRLSFLFLGVWLLLRLAGCVEQLQSHDRRQTHAGAVLRLGVKIFQIFILISGALLSLQILGYPISALLTLGGVGGLVLGIAFRDILANFFAGLVLYLDAPFRIGDYVSVRDRAYLGEIVRIGWRSTEIRTRERRCLHIPNNLLVTDMVENISATDRRRIREVFGIRYQDLSALPALTADLERLLHEYPDLDQEESPPLAVFDAFADYSLNIMIDALARTGEWRDYKKIRHGLFLEIAGIVQKHGADFAFPTQTLHIEPEQETQKKRASTATRKTRGPKAQS